MERLDPKTKGKATPGANTISSPFPEENGDSTPGDSSYGTCKHKHATDSLTWRIDGGQDTISDNENGANEGKGVEANEEK